MSRILTRGLIWVLATASVACLGISLGFPSPDTLEANLWAFCACWSAFLAGCLSEFLKWR